MPSADFCCGIKAPCDAFSHEFATRNRSPEVSSTAFRKERRKASGLRPSQWKDHRLVVSGSATLPPRPGSAWNPLISLYFLKSDGWHPAYRFDDLLARFGPQDYRDLQVWFNLVWCGYRARAEKPVLRELLRKGRMFSEEDKGALLDVQEEILREVIPRYRDAFRRGQAELTVSPFYHPILPLLINTEHARRAMPGAVLPPVFSRPEDAAAQIALGVRFFAETFGEEPRGMWPSEGSVSPELIPLARRAGIRWLASDEGILFRSLSGSFGRTHLYRAYRAVFEEAQVSLVFRDRNLSDLVGFTYAKNPAEPATRDLVGHLENIRKSLPDDDRRIVLIALDGENPWEAYPDGGEEFLTRLYGLLSRHPSIRTVRVKDFLQSSPPQETLPRLHSGSWIDQNFRIWIGSPEDNHAWDCLRRTRDFLESAALSASPVPEILAQAREAIYRAEGSDWFWWFGDDFTSDNDEEFDRLFRAHLAQVHRLLGGSVPDYLKDPVARPHEVKPAVEPIGLISPVLDGRITHFYEWREAGYFAAARGRGSMHQAEGFVRGLYYGFNLENLYFRIDPLLRSRNHLEGVLFAIHLLASAEFQILLPVQPPETETEMFRLLRADSSAPPRVLVTIGREAVIELAVPFRDLSCRPKERIDFYLRVQKNGLEIERHPRSGYLSLLVPDGDYEQAVWQV
jgi:alpha-amylase/alpha-mannosidase (GH57 family)